MTNTSEEVLENSEEKEAKIKAEEERQKALLEAEYARVRGLPHKIVNGIPIALTEEEIEEFNRPDPNQAAIDLEMKKNLLIKPRLEYLKETDWYVLRELDQEEAYPLAIKTRRETARQEINAIQSIDDLEQLESFTAEFR